MSLFWVFTVPLPDVLKHVEHLRGQVRVLHVKLCEVSLQQRGRGLLSHQGGGLPPNAQYSGTQSVRVVFKCILKTYKTRTNCSPSEKERLSLQVSSEYSVVMTHFRAIDRTLVLFLIRCFCDSEVEVGVEVEDKVCTWYGKKQGEMF